MSNRLGYMIISNPQRRSPLCRLRDGLLVLVTLGLWGLFITQTYLAVTSGSYLSQQAYVLSIVKTAVFYFVAVFAVFHVWVLYERILFKLRMRAYRRALEKQQAQTRLEATPQDNTQPAGHAAMAEPSPLASG